MCTTCVPEGVLFNSLEFKTGAFTLDMEFNFYFSFCPLILLRESLRLATIFLCNYFLIWVFYRYPLDNCYRWKLSNLCFWPTGLLNLQPIWLSTSSSWQRPETILSLVIKPNSQEMKQDDRNKTMTISGIKRINRKISTHNKLLPMSLYLRN